MDYANGSSLSDGGIEPEVVVPFTQKDVDEKRDPQLQKAIEVVKAQGGIIKR